MVAGWDEVEERRCADLHRGEGGAGGDEATEKLAHVPSMRRCAILSTLRRLTEKLDRRS
jgi:hypothetical protein